MNFSQRNLLITFAVVMLHGAALWALQAGLVHRPAELFVPVEISSALITTPQSQPSPAPVQAPPPRPQPQAQKTPAKKPSVVAEAPRRPVPRVEPTPSPEPASPSPAPQQLAPAAAPVAPPAEPTPAAPAATEPSQVELPSSNADYLQNPPPKYPPISKRLGEQGSVVVRVLIGADGRPLKAELKRSSGFDRLDRAALEYVMTCRYAPGKVNGVPQDMWYDAPVRFVLE